MFLNLNISIENVYFDCKECLNSFAFSEYTFNVNNSWLSICCPECDHEMYRTRCNNKNEKIFLTKNEKN